MVAWVGLPALDDLTWPPCIQSYLVGMKQPSLISDVNAAVAQCHSTPITIKVLSIKPEDIRWTCFTDSGFDTSEKARHQQGWIVGATNKYLNQGLSAPISVIHWRSRKLPRKAGSPQLVET